MRVVLAIANVIIALGVAVAGVCAVLALLLLDVEGGGARPQGGAVGGGGAIGSAGGVSRGLADSLYCQLTGCTMTGALTTATKTCNTLEVVLGGSTTGICDNGGGTRPVWRSNGTDIFEASTSVGMSVTQAMTLKSNLKSSTSTTTDAGTGTCTAVTVTGTVLDFAITATCTAAQTVIVTFSTAFGAAPRCVISSANSAAGAVTTGTPYQSAGATSSATFTFPAVTAGSYNVICAL